MARRRYCPNCGEEVEFLDFANSWFCEGCHEEFETQDTLDEETAMCTTFNVESLKRDCCEGCDGPFPSCRTTCSMYEDD